MLFNLLSGAQSKTQDSFFGIYMQGFSVGVLLVENPIFVQGYGFHRAYAPSINNNSTVGVVATMLCGKFGGMYIQVLG